MNDIDFFSQMIPHKRREMSSRETRRKDARVGKSHLSIVAPTRRYYRDPHNIVVKLRKGYSGLAANCNSNTKETPNGLLCVF